MGVSWVLLYPTPDSSGRQGQQAAADIERHLETIGATCIGTFTVDCDSYFPVTSANQKPLHVITCSEYPESSFTLLGDSPGSSPYVTADLMFIQLLNKLQGAFAPRTSAKVECRGNKYALSDFVVKVSTVIVAASLKGILVEVEYSPCMMPSQCMELMKEFCSGLLGSGTTILPPVYFQNCKATQQYMPIDTISQYFLHFNAFSKLTLRPQNTPPCIQICRDPDRLCVQQREYPLNHNVYVAGFGKAASGMWRAVNEMLSDHIAHAVLSLPHGSADTALCRGLQPPYPLEVYWGAPNNIPDECAFQAAQRVKAMAESLTDNDIFIVLVSGGGSALLPDPAAGVTLDEKIGVIRKLASGGADIFQLNEVRQHLSGLKGGGLTRRAVPAKVIGLIFSDVLGSDLRFVASGPTVLCRSDPEKALNLVRRFYAPDEPPSTVVSCLEEKVSHRNEADSAGTGCDVDVQNVLVGDNRLALEAAAKQAEGLGFSPLVVSGLLQGDADRTGAAFAALLNATALLTDVSREAVRSACQMLFPRGEEDVLKFLHFVDGVSSSSEAARRRLCFLWGGETTVDVRGRGQGGRNQQLVLSFVHEAVRLRLCQHPAPSVDVVLASLGTDGQDGPTDAAGAVVRVCELKELNLGDTVSYLRSNDAYHFFESFQGGKCHVKTGITGTNVMDIIILLVSFYSKLEVDS